MPKQAKNVQMRYKVPKYVANVWQWRELAGYLSMVYTVYKGVGLGLSAVAADFHDTAQIVANNFTFYRSIAFNLGHFDQS